MSSRALGLALIASVLLPIGAPLLAVCGFFVDHAAGYHGTCGPYPTDIPAYPCGFEEYATNFFGGFSGIALFMVALVTGVGAAASVAAAWGAWGLVVLARQVASRDRPGAPRH